MACLICASAREAEFVGEVMVHFSGLKNLNNPGVSVVRKLFVCLDCGFSRLTIPEAALPQLAQAAPIKHPAKVEQSVGFARSHD